MTSKVHTCTHTQTHTNIYIYTHTHTHIYIYLHYFATTYNLTHNLTYTSGEKNLSPDMPTQSSRDRSNIPRSPNTQESPVRSSEVRTRCSLEPFRYLFLSIFYSISFSFSITHIFISLVPRSTIFLICHTSSSFHD
jgi:hypothetical protein